MELFLPNEIKNKVSEWRENDYRCEYPLIKEIFDYNFINDDKGNKYLRYLRKAQFEALETYWYLRIIEKTPRIIDVYTKYFEGRKLLDILGLGFFYENYPEDLIDKNTIETFFNKIKNDNEFVKKNKLESIRETLDMAYPSYILALAMGAGKTTLIGAIIATEFSMAIEYGDYFVKNALVFAPGKTIVGALKEISDVPYDLILPERLYLIFITNLKISYTQDREKSIPGLGSNYNVIITNTEKIRIQKPTGKRFQTTLYQSNKSIQRLKEDEEIANLRLEIIASLPNLAVFSDEAHHTYGQDLENDLKKVRKTIDYLEKETNLIVVVNTTGTPYYKKQILKDVVFWYGLSQGIADGILKEVKNSIYSYEDISSKKFVEIVLEDFFNEYGNVKIENKSNSKIALYFPKTDDVKEIKPIVEKKIIELGYDPSIVLDINNKSNDKLKDYFNNRINDPNNPYRVYLLVNMGTEGWNCPSLFATALARKLKSSNNFVLQSASRCLRQVPGNTKKARIYLSKENVKILDMQLMETYGENLHTLDSTRQDIIEDKIVLRKTKIPPILVNKKIKKIVKEKRDSYVLSLSRPKHENITAKRIIHEPMEIKNIKGVLRQTRQDEIEIQEEFIHIDEAIVELSVIYRLSIDTISRILKQLYPENELSLFDLKNLKEQIENQLSNYKIIEEDVEIALALIKKEGFTKDFQDGTEVYYTEIRYNKKNKDLILNHDSCKNINKNNFSFHYSPYNLDSLLEREFFLSILTLINEDPDDIEDIYMTGSITDQKKTDFLFEYKDENGKWHNYTPDFLIKKRNGKVLIVEIKAEAFRKKEKEIAMKKIENLNPNKIKYEILISNSDTIGHENIQKIKNWVYHSG